MKGEELMFAIGELSDRTVEENRAKRTGSRKKRLRSYRRYTALASSLVLAAVAGTLGFYQIKLREGNMPQSDPAEIATEPGEDIISAIEQPEQPKSEERADISTLMSDPADAVVSEALSVDRIGVGPYTAVYEGMNAVSGDLLKECLGEEIEGEQGWYRVSGHEELQYAIRESGGTYTLWKFMYFQSQEYPYRDVLELIYGIDSAAGLRKIAVAAANMDNTEAGKRIQEEIGRYEITEPSDLQQMYDILSGLTCYGENRWDIIDYGANDNDMTEAVRLGRYLTFEWDGGVILDSLKYTAVSGMFYEYCGVAYNRLSEQDKAAVDGILGIDGVYTDVREANPPENENIR